MHQACNVKVEVNPTADAAFFDKVYTLTVGGRYYENRESTTYYDLPAKTYEFEVPAPDYTFEPLEEIIMDT